MDRATPEEVSERRSRHRSCGRCLKLTPWLPFLSISLFVGGIITWAIYANKTKNYTIDFANTIGADPDTTNKLNSATFSIILAVTIAGGVLMGIVLLLSLIRTAQRSMLWGGCCCFSERPQPWWYTTFAVINGLLIPIMWLLLLASVALLMVMLLWLGGSWAVRQAILDGTSTTGALAASDSAASVVDNLRTLAADTPTCAAGTPWKAAVDQSLAALVGGTSTSDSGVQVLCPPSCLNLGSFAVVMNLNSSCLCGSATLSAMLSIATNARQSSAIALGGAAAMYIACTILLMMLTSHGTTAAYDRRTASQYEKRREEEYERGFKANPADLHYISAPQPAPVMVHTSHDAV